MKYNQILSNPTVTYDRRTEELYGATYSAFLSSGNEIDQSLFFDAMEFYLRTLIEASATLIKTPAYTQDCWATPIRIKSMVSTSISKRLAFIDKRNSLWLTVANYFSPLLDALPYTDIKKNKPYNDFLFILGRIAWNVYQLILATKESCEIHQSPKSTIEMVDYLLTFGKFSSEGKSRLSLIKGIYNLYSSSDAVEGFFCTSSKGNTFTERIDEILEDAHYLEASRNRAFIGFGSDLFIIKKDIKKLLKLIVKNKPWAKGLISIVSQFVSIPKSVSEISGMLSEMAPNMKIDQSAPVLFNHLNQKFDRDHFMVSSRKDLFNLPHGWCLEATPIWGEKDNAPNKGRDIVVFTHKFKDTFLSSVRIDLAKRIGMKFPPEENEEFTIYGQQQLK